MHLVIGGDGMIGTALRHELERRHLPWAATTRREKSASSLEWPQRLFIDLAAHDFRDWKLPLITSGTVYLVAAMSKFLDCESNPLAWRVNVDGPIALAQIYSHRGAFVVFISSEAVEKAGGTAYGRHKAFAESYMQTIDAAIVRPAKIPVDQVGVFANAVVDIGTARRPGLTRWKAGEVLSRSRAA